MAPVNKKSPRRQARIQAFKVLYSVCFSPARNLEELEKAFSISPDQPNSGEPAEGFAWELAKGVWENQDKLDEAIAGCSDNWRVDRIGKVEITLLRLAMYELLFRPDIPPKAAINEAIELSKQFGDVASRSFVNGILDAAVKKVEENR